MKNGRDGNMQAYPAIRRADRIKKYPANKRFSSFLDDIDFK